MPRDKGSSSRIAPEEEGADVKQYIPFNWISLCILTLSASLLCYFPFFSSASLVYELGNSIDVLSSTPVAVCNGLLIGVSVSSAYSGFCDWYTLNSSTANFFPGILMCAGIFLNVVIYLALEQDLSDKDRAMLFFCTSCSRDCFVMIPMVFFMMGRNCTRREGFLRLLMLAVAISVILIAYPFSGFSELGQIFGLCLFILFLGGSVLIGGRGVYSLRRSSYLSADDEDNGAVFIQAYFYLSWVVYVLGQLVIHLSFGWKDWSDVGTAEVCCYMGFNALLVAVVSSLPVREAHYEVNADKNRLLAKKTFVRYISHEIRTPLNVVLVGLQMLDKASRQSAIDVNAAQTICTDSIEACAEALRILNELLLYDKIEEGHMVLTKTAGVSLEPVLQKAARMFSVQARGRNIDLTCQRVQVGDEADEKVRKRFVDSSVSSSVSATGVPTTGFSGLPNGGQLLLDIDVKKFSQVIHNLLSNAMKFTSERGSVCICPVFYPYEEIGSHVTSASGVVHLHVIDTGCGISKEKQSRLFKNVLDFDPDQLQNGNGTGLGLWLATKIMKQHGGTLRVRSDGHRGSTFTIIMPAKLVVMHMTSILEDGRSDVGSDIGGNSFQSTRSQSVTFTPYNPPVLDRKGTDTDMSIAESDSTDLGVVMLVDDSPLNRKMVRMAIKKHATTIYEECDGLKSVQRMVQLMAEDAAPDVILMDHQMPVMTGSVATQEIRKLGYKGRIVMLTGHALTEDVDTFMKAGADGVLNKPVNIAELLRVASIRSVRESEK